MWARLVLCLTIVAAFQARLVASPPVWEDVPVPGGIAAVAAALGIDPIPDRARFISELTRLAFETPVGRNLPSDIRVQQLKSLLTSTRRSTGGAADEIRSSDIVPIPLTVSMWGQAVFHRRLTATDLVAALLGDRRAALLCHGLAGVDDETLQFFAEHPALLTRIYERSAPAFGGFGAS